jgi:hypothetical protein
MHRGQLFSLLSRLWPLQRLVYLRQRFVHRCHGRKRPRPLKAGAHIGDIIDKNLSEIAAKKIKRKHQFSSDGAAELTAFNKRVLESLKIAGRGPHRCAP